MQSAAITWPTTAPSHGNVILRKFRNTDVRAIVALSNDPYIPLVTSLASNATEKEAAEWMDRQLGRLDEGVGFSFAIAEAETDRLLGQIGLWLKDINDGRANAGYVVTSEARRKGVGRDALKALTAFAWTISTLHRVELYIEPWNIASIRTAERAGYQREGLMRSHQQIGDSRRDMLLYATVRVATFQKCRES